MKTERNDNNIRLTKMEEEIKSLRALLSHVINTSSRASPFIPAHNSSSNHDYTSRQQSNRSESSSSRHKRSSLNLNYGGIDETNDYPVEMLMHIKPTQYSNDPRNNGRSYTTENGSANQTMDSNTVPSHNVYATQAENEQNDNHLVQMEKETLQLRRELQETIANQKRAEKKAQA